MKDPTHTPGPWTFDGKTVFAKGQPNVCRVENGHLIAAAPDLLKKLEAMVAVFNVKQIDPLCAFIAIEQAKFAIAKATEANK